MKGKYRFYVGELFGNEPILIRVRDYPRIQSFYAEKLKHFMYAAKILQKYVTHLSRLGRQHRLTQWMQSGCQSGPLFALYSVLCDVDEYDELWQDLFDICLRERMVDRWLASSVAEQTVDKLLRAPISQQAVADFIALALQHYVIQRTIQHEESRQHQFLTKNQVNAKISNISESDRYILSIVLPYFESTGLQNIHQSICDEPLSSGLFNRFCEPLTNEWCMKVSALDLKNKLLKHLRLDQHEVVKQCYVAVLQHVPAVAAGDKTRWTFYVRPSTHSEIFSGKHKINLNASTFNDYFEFRPRKVERMQYSHLILKVIDVSNEFSWAMWVRKKIRIYAASLGYWKLLSTFDENPRVSVTHLDGILALLRHPAVSLSLRNENEFVSVVFLKQLSSDLDDLRFDVEAEYQLTFWNGTATGNTSLALKLVRAVCENDTDRKRDSYFMHFQSTNEDIEWLWYDRDTANYVEYKLGALVPKAMEATYQGVREHMFPWEQFKRDSKTDIKESIFNSASLPYTSKAMIEYHDQPRAFVLRFTFDQQTGRLSNIEQLARHSYYACFARNVMRMIKWEGGWRHKMIRKYRAESHEMLYAAVEERQDWRQVVDSVLVDYLSGMQNEKIFELRLTDSFAIKEFEATELQGWYAGDSYVYID